MLRITNKSHNLIRSFQNFNLKITENSNKILTKVDEKVKGTFFEKWIKYWKTVASDYRDVAKDVHTDIKEKPLKALMLLTGFSGIYYCAKHNPDETDFRDSYLKAANQLLLVHTTCQKQETSNHLKQIEIYYNNQVIRRLNFGIGSIIWIDNFSDKCNTFEAQCSYLKLEYTKFSSRVLDIGFIGKWWILSNKMIDYDINY